MEEFIRLADPKSDIEQTLLRELQQLDERGEDLWSYFSSENEHHRRVIFFRLLQTASAQANLLNSMRRSPVDGGLDQHSDTASEDLFSSEVDSDAEFLDWSTKHEETSISPFAPEVRCGWCCVCVPCAGAVGAACSLCLHPETHPRPEL